MFGQSNIANYGAPTDTYNTANGVMRIDRTGAWEYANSPVNATTHLATGTGGNADGRIGDHLINSGDYDQVKIVNVSVGGTELAMWRPDAPLNVYPVRDDDLFQYTGNRLFERLEFAKQMADTYGFKYTHVLMHIGETDNLVGTTTAEFKADYDSVNNGLNSLGIDAPRFIGRTSYVPWATPTYSPNIIQAQNEIITQYTNAYAGPNTDEMVSTAYRHDGLHFSTTGLVLLSSLWASSIRTPTKNLLQ